jgi:hypothetical protein
MASPATLVTLPAGMLWARAAPEGSNSAVMALTHGRFGTTDPTPSALCGDVYPLPIGTPHLPVFSELNSIGAVYTNSLNVPDQYFGGIFTEPGSSPWFGITYQGMFWLTKRREFHFELTSDDGAKLYIDDRLIINNDRCLWAPMSLESLDSCHSCLWR